MNTALFNILLALFCLFYTLHFSFWHQFKRYAHIKSIPKPRLYTFLAPAIVAVCVIAIGLLFIMDSGVKFRLSLIIILIAPIWITHLRAAIAVDSKNESPTKHYRPVRMTSIFLYLTIIPLTIICCL